VPSFRDDVAKTRVFASLLIVKSRASLNFRSVPVLVLRRTSSEPYSFFFPRADGPRGDPDSGDRAGAAALGSVPAAGPLDVVALGSAGLGFYSGFGSIK